MRLRPVLLGIAVTSGAVVAGLALMEIGLRVAGISYAFFYFPDIHRGSALRANEEGWYRGEGQTYIRINSDGLRDREHSIAKPANTLRIAVLGDSFAEAFAVPLDKTFWAVLEARMARCSSLGGQRVEVINFGVSGYGTAQELITLRHHVWKYDPDIVLLAFFAGNDIRNNHPALNKNPKTPYFIYRNGQLVVDESFRSRLDLNSTAMLTALRKRLRILQLINEGRARFNQWRSGQALQNRKPAPGDEKGLDNAVFLPPADPVWEEAWRITEDVIVTMRDEVRARGAQFWIATVSAGIQVHPDSGVRRAFMERLNIQTLFYPDLRLGELARREQIPIIALAPRLAEYAEANQVFLHGNGDMPPGTGHWNEEGNRIAGEMIAGELCAATPRSSRTADSGATTRP
jgi:hypothetical protein